MLGRFRYQSIRNGLVGHWRPSRGATGNTLIDSVRGNHAALSGSPAWQANGAGIALNLDGVNDFANLGTNPLFNLTSNFCYGGWFAGTVGGMIINRTTGTGTAGYEVYLLSGAVICRADSNNVTGVQTAGSGFGDGRWHHAFVTKPASTIELYVNGAFQGSASATITSNGAASLQFGARASTGFATLAIDDLSIFNRVLTASEILTLYTAGRGALDQRVNVPVVRGYDPGVAGIEATLNITDGADTLAATSTVSLSATLTATDGSDTLSATATVASRATLAATDGSDTLSATATVQASASLTSTDGSDTLAASATVSISASASVTDGADTLEFTAVGVAQASVVLNATDGADSLSATAIVSVSSTLAATDGSDSLSASATVSISAALAATDGADSLVFTATSGGSVIGGIYLGQVVCYSQTVICEKTTVRAL